MGRVALIALVVCALALALTAHAVPLQRLRDRAQQKLQERETAAVAAGDNNTPVVGRDVVAGVTFVRKLDGALPLTPERLKAKEALLASDSFLFYRATPALYHSDMLDTKASTHSSAFRLNPNSAAPAATVVGGDMHAANFGTFREFNSKQQSGVGAVWGINDYDQSGPYQPADVDLGRFATSIVLAARALKVGAASATDQQRLVRKCVTEYFEEIDELTNGPKPAFVRADKAKGKIKALIADATARKRSAFLDKYSSGNDQNRRFTLTAGGDLLPVSARVRDAVTNVLAPKFGGVVYDVCERINSGGSSFGLPRFWALVQHPAWTPAQPKQPFLIELKLLLPPAQQPGSSAADGAALEAAQRAILGAHMSPYTAFTKDVSLYPGAWFLIREVEPEKDSLNLAKLSVGDLDDLVAAAMKVLARAHTQGGQPANAKRFAQWIPPAARAAAADRLWAFASAYAAQVLADHAQYKIAVSK